LAPERTTPDIIRTLTQSGVIVSAGHTNASYEQINAALEHGVTGFTHLFNAMSQLTGREPGVVGAALDHQNSWCGIIVDGHHVDPATLKLALRCKSHDQFMLVTDAMPSVGTDAGSFDLQGKRITVSDGACRDDCGKLAGSHLDMATAVRNAVDTLNLPLETALRMAGEAPASFLGIAHERGTMAPGCFADLVLLGSDLIVRETWIGGIRGTPRHLASA
jgi:N-acetylglucosamine-6-phosphate deacetylase